MKKIVKSVVIASALFGCLVQTSTLFCNVWDSLSNSLSGSFSEYSLGSKVALGLGALWSTAVLSNLTSDNCDDARFATGYGLSLLWSLGALGCTEALSMACNAMNIPSLAREVCIELPGSMLIAAGATGMFTTSLAYAFSLTKRPYIYACKHGYLSLVKAVPPVNQETLDKGFEEAVLQGQSDIVKYLLRCYHRDEWWGLCIWSYGLQELAHKAIEHGHKDIASLLYEAHLRSKSTMC